VATPTQDLLDRVAIVEVLDRYATALDRRDWALLDDVFTADACVSFRAGEVIGSAAIVAAIRAHLDGCGPTQHLLGNYRVRILGDRAESACYVRAIHVGAAAQVDRTYEVGIEYRDVLERTGAGWRIAARSFHTLWETGSRKLLGPGRSD